MRWKNTYHSKDKNMKQNYYIKDLLGNVRETYVHPWADYKECVQRMQYYPSGLPWSDVMGTSEQPYKYNDCYLSPLWVERLLQSFKVSRIRDACFTASLFQGFITYNSSPIRGGVVSQRGLLIQNSKFLSPLWVERLFARRMFKILISPLGRTIATYLPFGSNDYSQSECSKFKIQNSKFLIINSSCCCFNACGGRVCNLPHQ